ncbi:hypothetical protein CYMTET_48140 [Cymbomonas tetramitiformis]|uniref:Uncharacterized protein n=1 Tax=Cymbomonas tetramitiformis TaxID=36881 RepID=A0AAE0EVX9_9CHLO|nr:hypothetical protein CYMTET_48140 [Cymbomonas tetramitiformis]
MTVDVRGKWQAAIVATTSQLHASGGGLDVSFLVDLIIEERREREAIALGERVFAHGTSFHDVLSARFDEFMKNKRKNENAEDRSEKQRRLMRLSDLEFVDIKSAIEKKLQSTPYFDQSLVDEILSSVLEAPPAPPAQPAVQLADSIVSTKRFSQKAPRRPVAPAPEPEEPNPPQRVPLAPVPLAPPRAPSPLEPLERDEFLHALRLMEENPFQQPMPEASPVPEAIKAPPRPQVLKHDPTPAPLPHPAPGGPPLQEEAPAPPLHKQRPDRNQRARDARKSVPARLSPAPMHAKRTPPPAPFLAPAEDPAPPESVLQPLALVEDSSDYEVEWDEEEAEEEVEEVEDFTPDEKEHMSQWLLSVGVELDLEGLDFRKVRRSQLRGPGRRRRRTLEDCLGLMIIGVKIPLEELQELIRQRAEHKGQHSWLSQSAVDCKKHRAASKIQARFRKFARRRRKKQPPITQRAAVCPISFQADLEDAPEERTRRGRRSHTASHASFAGRQLGASHSSVGCPDRAQNPAYLPLRQSKSLPVDPSDFRVANAGCQEPASTSSAAGASAGSAEDRGGRALRGLLQAKPRYAHSHQRVRVGQQSVADAVRAVNNRLAAQSTGLRSSASMGGQGALSQLPSLHGEARRGVPGDGVERPGGLRGTASWTGTSDVAEAPRLRAQRSYDNLATMSGRPHAHTQEAAGGLLGRKLKQERGEALSVQRSLSSLPTPSLGMDGQEGVEGVCTREGRRLPCLPSFPGVTERRMQWGRAKAQRQSRGEAIAIDTALIQISTLPKARGPSCTAVLSPLKQPPSQPAAHRLLEPSPPPLLEILERPTGKKLPQLGQTCIPLCGILAEPLVPAPPLPQLREPSQELRGPVPLVMTATPSDAEALSQQRATAEEEIAKNRRSTFPMAILRWIGLSRDCDAFEPESHSRPPPDPTARVEMGGKANPVEAKEYKPPTWLSSGTAKLDRRKTDSFPVVRQEAAARAGATSASSSSPLWKLFDIKELQAMLGLGTRASSPAEPRPPSHGEGRPATSEDDDEEARRRCTFRCRIGGAAIVRDVKKRVRKLAAAISCVVKMSLRPEHCSAVV